MSLFVRLVRGVDTQDRICGVSPGVEDKPLAVWPGVPGQTGLRSVNPITLFSIKTCVSSCDATLSSDVVVSPYPSRKCKRQDARADAVHRALPNPI